MDLKTKIKNILGIKEGYYTCTKNKIKYAFSIFNKNKIIKYQGKKKAILTITPTHGNLGDHAIAYAAEKYIKDNFKEYEFIELNMFEIYKYGKALKTIVTEEDIIFTIGGGNMNNHYIIEEETRRFIINTFKGIPIVSLPQTISFTKDENGQRELNKTKDIYNSNENLSVVAREDISFKTMKNEFNKVNVLKNPDMVLYLENLDLKKCIERKYIMVCLRNDLEGYIKPKERENIINTLSKSYDNVIVFDTVIDRDVDKVSREKELKNMWYKFFQSRVVITDRLHGMIFCVITKTPCIVIRTFDHKVVESYKWFKELNYIKLTEDYSSDNLINLYEELMLIQQKTCTNFKNDYFKGLREKLNL